MANGSSLRSEQLFCEDTNKVGKRFCMNLLFVYSYLLSKGTFMSVLRCTDHLLLTDLR